MDFRSFQQRPKAELHVHLEGAILPERIIAWVNNLPDHPWHGQTAASLASQFKMATFPQFIKAFMRGYRLLHSAARFQQITEDLCASFEQQGVVYAEILYSPGVLMQHHHVPIEAIHKGIQAGLRHFPALSTRFILDTVLNLGPAFMEKTLDTVLNHRPEFLGGFSVGGGVADISMEPFLPLFEKAQQADLFCVAHVGEVDGPENIEQLVTRADLQRVAHGCAAAESPRVLELLRQRNITIDVCPTSNRFTGASARFTPHPAKTFLDHGIPITLNTDDPLYFGCDLFNEYHWAKDHLELDETELRQIMAHGLSFREKNQAAIGS